VINLPTYRESRVAAAITSKPRTRSAGIAVTKRHTILYLPAFEVDATWRGASEIVKEFRYSASNNMSIVKRATPTNPNFVACVAWKPTAETIVRYKLWEDVGEILYVPLYNGEKIDGDFSIEIWNTKPDAAITGGDTLITESDGFELSTESEDVLITDGSDSLYGTVETLSHAGTALFHLSKMTAPVKPWCDLSANQIEYIEECTDVTIDLTGFNPFVGDYYNVIGDCGLTELVNGATLATAFITLQSTDLTWHNVYVMRLNGITHLVVDQDNTVESLTPYVHVAANAVDYIKLDLMYLNGVHHLRISQEPEADISTAYGVIYFLAAEDGLYYAVRASEENDVYHVQIAQENTVL
jgi:hypothetical protein